MKVLTLKVVGSQNDYRITGSIDDSHLPILFRANPYENYEIDKILEIIRDDDINTIRFSGQWRYCEEDFQTIINLAIENNINLSKEGNEKPGEVLKTQFSLKQHGIYNKACPAIRKARKNSVETKDLLVSCGPFLAVGLTLAVAGFCVLTSQAALGLFIAAGIMLSCGLYPGVIGIYNKLAKQDRAETFMNSSFAI